MTRILLFAFFISALFPLAANNISVSNISLTGQNTTNSTTQVKFDLSWENSWRISVGPSNYDAAWVFVKYRVNGSEWRHATLSQTGNVAPAGAAIDVPADQVGAYVYRSADGSGNVSYTGLELQWEYGTNGVDNNALIDVQVFAIEMVYVPEGSFTLGGDVDDSDAFGHFYEMFRFGDFFLQRLYTVDSEAAITVGTSTGNLYYNDDIGSSGDQLGPITANFPKGFRAFYCMKYEASQDQWVGFFNTLTPAQKDSLDITDDLGKSSDDPTARNTVAWPDNGNATTASPNLPVTYMTNQRILAYLDWAGLRPMTEFEYEKACRGTLPKVTGEFAWRTTNITTVTYELINENTPQERINNISSGTGNTVYNSNTREDSGTRGPARVGSIAASAILQNREDTGGSYYGIMELSGNVYELTISAGKPEGRAFAGFQGDGVLPPNGRHNVLNWPSSDTEGFGYRGGGYYSGFQNELTTADRTNMNISFIGVDDGVGFRGVRTE